MQIFYNMRPSATFNESVGMYNLIQLKKYRTQILSLAEQRGAYNVRVFGSVARGEETEYSDIDFLVMFESQCSLFDQGGLLADLEDLLGCHVDILSERALRPHFKDRVLKEAVLL